MNIQRKNSAHHFRMQGEREQTLSGLLKYLYTWQHRDYRTLTALSLGLRPRELGQLSTIIPHNHGITITYICIYFFFLLWDHYT